MPVTVNVVGYQNTARLSKTPISLIIFAITLANGNRAVRYDAEKMIYL